MDRMGSTNKDASQLTFKRSTRVLYSWKKMNDAQVLGGLSVVPEQTSQKSALVVLERKLGASACGCETKLDLSTTYPFNGTSTGTAVQ